VTCLEQINNALELSKTQPGPLLIEVAMEGATECRPRLAYGSKLDEQYPKRNIKTGRIDP
jgi:acetolactate synthase I/II/III large subunit